MILISSLSQAAFIPYASASDLIPASAYECTQVTLNDYDEQLLTRAEKIALMDQSLSDSIDNYTVCVNTVQLDMSGGGSGSGLGSGEAGGNDAGDQAAQSSGNGPGTSEQQGSESSDANRTNEQSQSNGASQAGTVPVNNQSQSTTSSAKRGVVAPKDNDSIICQLLFDEINQASGAALEGLEKQYREYQCGT
jgi:hypothetical protein